MKALCSTIADVGEAFDVGVRELREKSRRKHINRARHALCYVLRERDKLSFPTIGRIVGRDHTTALHGHRMAIELLQTDIDFDCLIEELMEQPPRPAPSRFLPASEVAKQLTSIIFTPRKVKPKNELADGDTDAIDRMRGTIALGEALKNYRAAA